MTQGLHVDIDELRNASRRILEAVHDVNIEHIDDAGKNRQAYGNQDIERAVLEFCQDARESVRKLTELTHSTGIALSKSADHYLSVDDQIRAALERTATSH